MPHRIVWWVSSFRSSPSAGSSSMILWRPIINLSSSPLVRGWIAFGSNASGASIPV